MKQWLKNFPLLKYFSPKHVGLYKPTVQLNKALMIGDIGVGKTTTAQSIFSMINRLYDDYEQLNIYTRDWGRLINMHKDEPLTKKLQKADMINIFFDDAATTLSSRSYSVEKISNWFMIRHYFMNEIGKKEGTVNIIFAIQRFRSLANFIRGNTAQMIWKAYPVIDPDDEKEVNTLTRGKARLLQYWAYKITYEQDYSYMSKNLIVPVLHAPYEVNIPPLPSYNGTEELVLEEILPSAESLKRRKVKDKVTAEPCHHCGKHPVAIKKYKLCKSCYNRWNAGKLKIPTLSNIQKTGTVEAIA